MTTQAKTRISSDLTVEEFATQVGMHPDSVRRLIRQHVISAYVVNPQARKLRYRITHDALSAFQEQAPEPHQFLEKTLGAETTLKPGSTTWLALLRSMGEGREAVGLGDDDLRRENLYGDDLR